MYVEVGLALEPHFEAAIKKEPDRFNAFAGAAKAGDRLGESQDYFQKLMHVFARPDRLRLITSWLAGMATSGRGCCRGSFRAAG
jgi:hypothetical protein